MHGVRGVEIVKGGSMVITTPEIESLTKQRDALRGKARKIEERVWELKRKEKERLIVEKESQKEHVTGRLQHDKQMQMREIRRLRLTLADYMAAHREETDKIKKACGVSETTIRSYRIRSERERRLRTMKTRGYRATVANRERRDPVFKEALREERRKEG
jgi:hypothetical protein